MSKIALITGGSRGLGRSMVLALAKKGVDSIFTYASNEDAALAVVDEVKQLGSNAVVLQFEATDFTAYNEFAARVKALLSDKFNDRPLDFLINNAGTGLHKSIADTTMEDMDFLYQLHVKAPYFLTQSLLSEIADNGHIVNLSSGLARFSVPGASAYAMMKGAVEVMTRYMAKELGERGISVNTLAPGAIATDFNGGAVRDNPQMNQFVSSVTAKGRVGEAEDIGPLVASLLTSDANWMTGQRIEASGGMFL